MVWLLAHMADNDIFVAMRVLFDPALLHGVSVTLLCAPVCQNR